MMLKMVFTLWVCVFQIVFFGLSPNAHASSSSSEDERRFPEQLMYLEKTFPHLSFHDLLLLNSYSSNRNIRMGTGGAERSERSEVLIDTFYSDYFCYTENSGFKDRIKKGYDSLSQLMSEHAAHTIYKVTTFDDYRVQGSSLKIIKEQILTPEVRELVTGWGRLKYLTGVYRPDASIEFMWITNKPQVRQHLRFPLDCYECTHLKVKNQKKRGRYRVSATLSGIRMDGSQRVKDVSFSGYFIPHKCSELVLASDDYGLSVTFRQDLKEYLQDHIRFRKALASVLHLTGERVDFFGLALLNKGSLIPTNLLLAGELSNISSYIGLLTWDNKFNPDQANDSLTALAVGIRELTRTVTFNTTHWTEEMLRLGMYDLFTKDDPIESALLFLRFPPVQAVRVLIEKHPDYLEEYAKNLLCFIRTGMSDHRGGHSGCHTNLTMEIFSKRMLTWRQYFQTNDETYIFGTDLRCRAKELLGGSDDTSPKVLWNKTFGFKVDLLHGLALLRALGRDGRLTVPSSLTSYYFRELFFQDIKEVYLKLAPLDVPSLLPTELKEEFIDRVVTLVFEKKEPTVSTAVRRLRMALEEIEQNLRDFPSLPQEFTRGRVVSKLLQNSEANIGLIFTLMLEQYISSQKPVMPQLATGEDIRPRFTRHNRNVRRNKAQDVLVMKSVALRLYEANRGRMFDDIFKTFTDGLRCKYDELLAKGWIGPHDCEEFIFDTEILHGRRHACLAPLLNDWPYLCQYIDDNFSFLHKIHQSDIQSAFYEGVARILLEPGQDMTVEQACQKYFPQWLRETFELLHVQMPTQMIDEVVTAALTPDVRLVDVLAQRVPELYEMLLGPEVVLANNNRCPDVAKSLLQQKSFLDVHCLRRGPSYKEWVLTILESKNIPPEDYDLQAPERLQSYLDKAAETLAIKRTGEYWLWRMDPFEVVCRVRQANQVNSKTSEDFKAERAKLLVSKLEKAIDRKEKAVTQRKKLTGHHYWDLDGRNPIFDDAAARLLDDLDAKEGKEPGGSILSWFYTANWQRKKYVLALERLAVDPYLTFPDEDPRIPDEISDEVYNQMQDTLCDLARKHILSERAKMNCDGQFTKEDEEVYEDACYLVHQFFRLAITNTEDYLSPEIEGVPDQGYRRRVNRIYDRIFEPLLATGQAEQAYRELEFIMANSGSCIDASRRMLLVLEQDPRVVRQGPAPDLFERLAYILREFKLAVITKISFKRAKKDRFPDEVCYDLFLRNALSLALSLGLEDCEQYYLGRINYDTHKLDTDLMDFIEEYQKGLIPTVMAAIRYRGMPAYDEDPSVIYMTQISQWADKSTHYCNSYELDKDLMEGESISPQVVANLLEDAGYISLRE